MGACHLSTPQVTLRLKRSTLHRIGRTTLRRWFTWTCSIQRAQLDSHLPTGGLLHHLLTLAKHKTWWRSFSSALTCRHRQLLFSEVDCPMLPGLSSRIILHHRYNPWQRECQRQSQDTTFKLQNYKKIPYHYHILSVYFHYTIWKLIIFI